MRLTIPKSHPPCCSRERGNRAARARAAGGRRSVGVERRRATARPGSASASAWPLPRRPWPASPAASASAAVPVARAVVGDDHVGVGELLAEAPTVHEPNETPPRRGRPENAGIRAALAARRRGSGSVGKTPSRAVFFTPSCPGRPRRAAGRRRASRLAECRSQPLARSSSRRLRPRDLPGRVPLLGHQPQARPSRRAPVKAHESAPSARPVLRADAAATTKIPVKRHRVRLPSRSSTRSAESAPAREGAAGTF